MSAGRELSSELASYHPSSGAVSALFEGVGTMCIELSKNRQVAKWKKGYIKGILRQDVGWYDVNKPQELSTRMGESLVHIESGLSIGTAGLFCAGLPSIVSIPIVSIGPACSRAIASVPMVSIPTLSTGTACS